MIIGIAREIKIQEYRVGLTPSGVLQLCNDGHRVLMGQGAGQGSGFVDTDYSQASGILVDRDTLFAEAGLVIKVKEPLAAEYDLLRPGL